MFPGPGVTKCRSTWAATLKEDLVQAIRPAVVGIRRWNKESASLAVDLVQDRRAWAAAIRDAKRAMDADSARADHNNNDSNPRVIQRNASA